MTLRSFVDFILQTKQHKIIIEKLILRNYSTINKILWDVDENLF